MRTITALPLLAAVATAQAHEGHGLGGPHLHGWDLLGLAVAAVVVVALLISRRR